MGMATAQRLWTVEERNALPEDGRRYEVIDGVLAVNGVEVPGGDLNRLDEIVTPAPSWIHQNAVLALARRLHAYIEPRRLGHVQIAPADMPLDDDAVVEPDVFVVPLVNGRAPLTWDAVQRMLLAVEVISPSSARWDRGAKRHAYQRQDVPEYWIVDTDARLVERWRPSDERPEVLSERIELLTDNATEPLVIDLREFFAEVFGE